MKNSLIAALALQIGFAVVAAVAQTAAPLPGQPANAAPKPAPPKPAAKPAAPKQSQVDAVIQLVKNGMSENFVIKYLQKNNKPADLTPADIVKLKQAGVSETIIGVMMDPSSAPAPAAPAAPVAPEPEATAPLAPVPPPVEAPPVPPPAVAAPPPPVPPAAAKTIAPGDWKAALQDRLEKEFPLTQPSGDNTSIVTPGGIIMLKRNFMAMYLSTSFSNQNTFKGGPTIANGFFGALCRTSRDGSCRMFVKGEKFWVTEIAVKDDGVVFQFLSDPMPDDRYHGALKIPFAKGAQPNQDEIVGLAKQCLEMVGMPQPAPAEGQAAPAPVPPIAPPSAPMAPIPAPAPPTPSIQIGQTRDQLVAAMGQPQRIANANGKQIYFYENLKVTMVGGKISAIE